MNLYILLACSILLLPLFGAMIAGLLGHTLGKTWTHRILITLIAIAFSQACYLFNIFVLQHTPRLDVTLYTWATSANVRFDVGILLDQLSCVMSVIVLFVSLMVHLYSIGYMHDDPGYTRFFSYVSLFTFAMLLLVLANNFLVLFVGWEGVGLVSYLLIGFWFKKESAAQGSLKAFLVNRLGDIGFLLAIAVVFMFFGSLNYLEVFAQVPFLVNKTITIFPNTTFPLFDVMCILLLIGAMAKSAQVPLHVWLPESMEGPTPISALIHAATMVTAGIYMVARMSPLFEFSATTLSLLLMIGGTTALFMGLIALVQQDIKRVIAYSTISQLGYMAVALGASAYDAAIFHLVTHAFFKALLFLAAGSVIIALHHEQDMRKMGGLAWYLPVTYLTFVIGALALCAIPPFAGFYSKDIIIEAVHESTLTGAHYAYYCVLLGAFVTSLYTFRALFLTFHGHERAPLALRKQIQEPTWVVWLPLVLLAIPSVLAGQVLITPMLFAKQTLLGNSIFVLPKHNVLQSVVNHYSVATNMALTAGSTLTFWLAIAGIVLAWWFILIFPSWTNGLKQRFALIYQVLLHSYGFDAFNQYVVVKGTRAAGELFYQVSDVKLIDHFFVNGSGRVINWLARFSKKMQSGYLYHYALVMMLGTAGFLVWAFYTFDKPVDLKQSVTSVVSTLIPKNDMNVRDQRVAQRLQVAHLESNS